MNDYSEDLRGGKKPHSHLYRHRVMKDSDTYWAIFDEGRMEQAKADILRFGKKRFGPAEESTITKLNVISDLELLHRIMVRLLDATSWQELLDTP